jgi:acetylornithine deacetylase/succinyl-diaminopimelate desuccinylase-like protein
VYCWETFWLHSHEKNVGDEIALRPGVAIREDQNLVKIAIRYTRDVTENAHAVNEWVTLSGADPTIAMFAGIAQEYFRSIKE